MVISHPSNILIVTFGRCGARYLTAFLCNYFKEFNDYSGTQIDLTDTISFSIPKTIYKTHSEYKPSYNINIPIIVLSRDTNKIIKTYEKEDDVNYDSLYTQITAFYDTWKTCKDTINIDYDDVINNKNYYIEKFQSLFNVTFHDNNNRLQELTAGLR